MLVQATPLGALSGELFSSLRMQPATTPRQARSAWSLHWRLKTRARGGLQSLQMVIELLELLSGMDVQPNGQWKCGGHSHRFPGPMQLRSKANRWLPMMKDTTKACIFAVSISNGLSITVDGVFSRTCQEVEGRTGLRTTVMGSQELTVWQKLSISGLLLTVNLAVAAAA